MRGKVFFCRGHFGEFLYGMVSIYAFMRGIHEWSVYTVENFVEKVENTVENFVENFSIRFGVKEFTLQ